MDTRYSISVYTLPGEEDLRRGWITGIVNICVYTVPGEQDLGDDGYQS